MTVTFLVNGRFYTVQVRYFSRDATLNRCCFALSIHRQSSAELQAFEQALFVRDKDEELARRKLRRFYVRDVEVCRRAGLIGFRDD